jgi:hypothetical protein
MEGLADRIIENIQKVVEKYPDWSVSTHISYAAGAVSHWTSDPGAQMSLMDVEKLLRYLAGIPEGEMK